MPPEAANRPSATRAIVIAVLLSFMGVFGIGTLSRCFETRFRARTSWNVAGRCPHGYTAAGKARRHQERGNGPADGVHHPNSYFECIHRFELRSCFGTGERTSRLVVTSTDADEGKSSIALNLAFSFAQMRRTLIVDCDLRRPSLERALLPDKRHPIGLTDALAGAAEIDACLVGRTIRVCCCCRPAAAR